MELVFLGHQSWLVQHESSALLVDPLLLDRFGHSAYADFRIYPPRSIDLDSMPEVDAVVLSHEHLDHFHLPSLDRLSREASIFVGELMPECVVEAIEELGFRVTRQPLCQPVRVKGLEFVLYPAAADTIFWEKRVTQILVYPAEQGKPQIFIAVDALVSEEYKRDLRQRRLDPPRAVVCSNNSQIAPPNTRNARSNLLPIPNPFECGLAGLRVLHTVLVDSLTDMPQARDLVLCGNGFIGGRDRFIHLFSDHRQLAEIANQLSIDQTVHGVRPGEVLRLEETGTVTSRVDWISLQEEEMEAYAASQRAPAGSGPVPLTPLLGEFASVGEAIAGLESVEDELRHLARAILTAPLGVLALHTNNYLGRPLGPRRILLRLLRGPGDRVIQYALDLARSEFVRDDTPVEDLLLKFPFGLEVNLIDLVGLLKGRIQVWDLAGTGMRSWFVGGPYENWMSFLFGHYGEQVRPDLAVRIFEGAMRRMRDGLCKL